MTGRKCGTCKHFEPAPMWRKGWCRNPLLFSPQQSHLVNDEELDCERGMGNYWEVADSARAPELLAATAGFREPVARAFASQTPSPDHLVSESGRPVYPVTGAAGQGGDRPPYDDPPPGGGWSGGDPPNSTNRDYNYYPEERYWTDYLRIAAPILGVILMVFLFWWWVSNFLNDDDNDNDPSVGQNETPVTIPTVGETPDTQPEATPSDGTPGIVFPSDGTPGTGQPTNPPEATQPPDTTDPPPPDSGIFDGATVEVFNTGGTGVNVRSQPSTEAAIITVFLDGTILTVIGVSIDAEGFVWWPVSGDGVEGYVVQEYLTPVQ
jgi:hypothetical protein